MSLVICTKNRVSQLKQCLNEIVGAAIPPCELEIVLADNGSEDSTSSGIKDFADTSALKVATVYCKNPGLGLAIITISSTSPEAKGIKYGSGPIIPYDKQRDPRVATLLVEKIKLIPPRTLMPAGVVQGANMFFHKSIFQSAGNSNEKMGSGTPFACEDIEMAAHASLAGFAGAQFPYFKVAHHHRRLIGSAESDQTVVSYDYGRGAYYASLIDQGFPHSWKLWEACSQLQNIRSPILRMRLARELEGAAKYLNAIK